MKRLVIAFLALAALLMIAGLRGQDQSAGSPPASDHGWPKIKSVPGGTIVVYQPQVQSYDGGNVSFRVAVGVTLGGAAEPIYGCVWVSGKADADYDKQLVTLFDLKVDRTKFPDTPDGVGADDLVRSSLQKTSTVIHLNRFLAGIQRGQIQSKRATEVKYNNDPPAIYVATAPTVLVLLDGEPQMRAVGGTSAKMAVNTAFTLLQDPDSGSYYILAGQRWMKAPAYKGPWTAAEDVPKGVLDAYESVQSAVLAKQPPADTQGLGDQPAPQPASAPQAAGQAAQPSQEVAPQVIVSTGPAALIQFDGAPQWSPVDQTKLLCATNTENDVISEPASKKYFVLLSGRWFSTDKLENGATWIYTPSKSLPADFANIPEDTLMGRVLYSVYGTPQSIEAVIQAQIPQTAHAVRGTSPDEVRYGGDPSFKPVQGVPDLSYAVNTPDAVLQYKGAYYLCKNGLWFSGAGPKGPWKVTDNVPTAIYAIPPDNPLHYVTYVFVYGSDDTSIDVGYLAGYTGGYVDDGTLVYGTGYDYPSYVAPPVYMQMLPGTWIAYPWTYGWGYAYDPWACGWAVGYGIGMFDAAWFGPFAWNCGWWGPGWGCGLGWGNVVYVNNIYVNNHGNHPYNPNHPNNPNHPINRPNGLNMNRQQGGPNQGGLGHNVYKNQWDASKVTSRYDRGSMTRAPEGGYKGLEQWHGETNKPGQERVNNVFAGKDGNVYRKGADGGWNRYDGGSGAWQKHDFGSDAEGRRGLDQDLSGRDRGAQHAGGFGGGTPGGWGGGKGGFGGWGGGGRGGFGGGGGGRRR